MVRLEKIGSDSWRLSDADCALVNMIRHSLMADVPVQAVESVTFHQYSGALESTLISHRLGQLPIKGLEPLEFEINVQAAPNKPLTWITSHDIKGDTGRVVRGNEDGKGAGFLLVPLLAGQKLHVTCRTSLGTGRKRTTWNSTFPVVHHLEDGSCIIKVETTGAVTPAEAWDAALQACQGAFKRLLLL
jgi:DNA-directed RNA polymerase alpha subunit